MGALFAFVAVTAAWWLLALWPAPTDAPEWLERTREICFGSTETGLPDAGGWLLLIGQPLGMLVAMGVIWGRALRGGLWALSRTAGGRLTLAATGLLLAFGVAGAGVRVASARAPSWNLDSGLPPSTYPRLDRPAPPLGLLDQHGDTVDWRRLAGRKVLLTFAYAHCGTICPTLVHNTLEAARAVAELDPVVVVVTLDPWRDTPSRLPYIARQWGLRDGDLVLSGEVHRVESVLHGWNLPRTRDTRTGEVSHPPVVYVVDQGGTIAFASTGDPEAVAALALRM